MTTAITSAASLGASYTLPGSSEGQNCVAAELPATESPAKRLADVFRAVSPHAKPFDQRSPKSRDLDNLAASFVERPDPDVMVVDVPGAQADFVRTMPLRSWQAVKTICGEGARSVSLGAHLSCGGPDLAAGIRAMGVNDIYLKEPASGNSIHFSDVRDPNSSEPHWEPVFHVHRDVESPGTLKHIFVPIGASVIGHGFGEGEVQVHFTDSQGHPVKTVDLVSAGPLGKHAFGLGTHVLNRMGEGYAGALAEKRVLFEQLDGLVRGGQRLDLSQLDEETRGQVDAMTTDDWAHWLKRPGTADLTSVVGDGLLSLDGLAHHGIKRISPMNLTTADADGWLAAPGMQRLTMLDMDSVQRDAFCRAVKGHLPDYPPHEVVFDSLISLIKGKVLDMSRCNGGAALILQRIPEEAWHALLEHPRAAGVESILESDDLKKIGGLPIRLVKFVGSAQATSEPADPANSA